MDNFMLGLALAWYLVFIFSTVCHEAAHALVAFKLGDPTGYHGGQVSLNPVPHIRREPFGMVVIPLLSFLAAGWMLGWASTPYDPTWSSRYPRRSALMALAGPLANLLLLIFAALMIRIGIALGHLYPPDSVTTAQIVAASTPGAGQTVAIVLSILFMLNLVLLFFNLLPLPPLDGSGILPLLMSGDQARRYQDLMAQPVVSVIGLVIAWRLFGALFAPLQLLAVNLLYPGLHYQ